MLIKIQLDTTVCRYLCTAKLLYMFRVSQHPSSGVLKTVTAASGTGHNTGAATSLQAGAGAHPASGTMGTGSFLGVKRMGRGFDHSSTYSSQVKERVQLYIHSPSGTSWPVLG